MHRRIAILMIIVLAGCGNDEPVRPAGQTVPPNSVATPSPPVSPQTVDAATPPASVSLPGPELQAPEAGVTLPNLESAEFGTTFVWSFDWADVPGADLYQLAVQRSEDSRRPMLDVRVEDSAFEFVQQSPVRAMKSDDWTWKVRARVDLQWTAWSPPRSFHLAKSLVENKDVSYGVNVHEAAEPTLATMPTAVETLPRMELATPESHGGFFGFTFSPDGMYVAGGTGLVTGFSSEPLGGEVLLWNAQTGELVQTLGNIGASANWLAFSADGTRLAAAAKGAGLVKIWNVADQSLIQTFELGGIPHSQNGFFPLMALSLDGQLFVSVLQDEISLGRGSLKQGGRLSVRDVQTGKKVWGLDDSKVGAIALLPDGEHLLAFTRDLVNISLSEDGFPGGRSLNQTLTIYNLRTGDVTEQLSARGFSPLVMLPLPDGSAVVACDNRGLVVLELPGGEVRQSYRWHEDRWAFSGAKLSADGTRLGRSWSDYVEVLDLSAGTFTAVVIGEFPHIITSTNFAPDLMRIACDEDGPAVLPLTMQPAN